MRCIRARDQEERLTRPTFDGQMGGMVGCQWESRTWMKMRCDAMRSKQGNILSELVYAQTTDELQYNQIRKKGLAKPMFGACM